MTPFSMPALPLGGDHALVLRWLVAQGAMVEAGQPLLVVLSERAEIVLAAPSSGILAALTVGENETVHVGAPLAEFATAPAQAPQRISPVARRVAAAFDVDWAALQGTGPSGIIRKRDVLAAAGIHNQDVHFQHASSQYVLEDEPPDAVKDQPVLPWATVVAEADFRAVLAYGAQQRTGANSQLDLRACVAFAVAQTLLRHSWLNSQWSEAGIVIRRRVQLAVDDQIVLDAQDLTPRGIARQLVSATAAEAATFALCFGANNQWSGVAPSVVPTLHVGRISPQPWVVGQGNAEHVAVCSVGRLTLGYDARLNDVFRAAAFLRYLRALIEQFDPGGALLTVAATNNDQPLYLCQT